MALNNRTAALDGLLNPISGLTMTDFGAYQAETSSSRAMLTLNGVRLVAPKTTNGGNSTAPDDYLFGYFDCHPNGLRSGAQVNPYTTGRTGNDNSNGDPMDISWAVEADGTPKYLDAVRYVRVYTGVMQMNGIMGESSSELLGSHKAVTNGTGAASTTPTVKVGTSIVETTNMDVATKKVYSATTKVTVTSSAEKIFVNGAQVASGTEMTISTPTSSTNYVQIITQSGTESPYITLLKITR